MMAPDEWALAHANRVEVARKSGYSRRQVGMLLAGKVNPSFRCAKAVADAIGVTLDQLWEFVEAKKKMDAESEKWKRERAKTGNTRQS